MSSCVVKDIVRTVLHVPFHERCADTMEVYGPGWSIVELIEVETEGGVVGIGETIQGYTWGHSREAEFARVRGRKVFEMLWDDSLGGRLADGAFRRGRQALRRTLPPADGAAAPRRLPGFLVGAKYAAGSVGGRGARGRGAWLYHHEGQGAALVRYCGADTGRG